MNREGGFFDQGTGGQERTEQGGGGGGRNLDRNTAPRASPLPSDEPASGAVASSTSVVAPSIGSTMESSEKEQGEPPLKLSPRASASGPHLQLSSPRSAISSKPGLAGDKKQRKRDDSGLLEAEGGPSRPAAASAIAKAKTADYDSDDGEQHDGDPDEPDDAAVDAPQQQEQQPLPLKLAPGAVLSEDKTTAKKGKKSWKKPEGMPKRPLSAYNLYFRVERQRMLGGEPAAAAAVGEAAPDALARSIQVAAASAAAATASSGGAEKRKHRRTHGKVGFADMAKIISEKWKSMTRQERLPYEVEASQEKQRYLRELERWKSTPKRLLVLQQQLEQQQHRRMSEDEIVRMVSLEKSGSEDNKESPATAAAATGSSSSLKRVTAQIGTNDADWDATLAATSATTAAAMGQFRAARAAESSSQAYLPLPSEPSSPRSETAALLIAMPTAVARSEAVGYSGAPSQVLPPQSLRPPPHPGTAIGVGFLGGASGGVPLGGIGLPAYLLPGYGYVGGPVGATAALQPIGLGSSPPAYGAAAGISPSLPLSVFEYEYRHAADFERRRVLEDRYRSHMAEAASLRAELDRSQQPPSGMPFGVAPAPAGLAPQTRRYSEPVPHGHDVPVELRRFASNPQEISIAPQQQFLFQQLDPSQSLYGDAMSTVPPTQQQQQEMLQLQSPFLSQYGLSAPPTSSLFTTESLAIERAAMERARQDLLALERAAELRRADLARWNEQAASSAAASAGSGPPPSWRASPPAHPLASSLAPSPHVMMRATPPTVGYASPPFLPSNPLDQQQQPQLLLRQQYPQQPPTVSQPSPLYPAGAPRWISTAPPVTAEAPAAGGAAAAQSAAPAPIQHPPHPAPAPSPAPPGPATAPPALPPS